MGFLIDVEIVGDVLNAHAVGSFDKGDLFYCYLLRYGKVVARVNSWQKDNNFSWRLLEEGLYSVQMHLKRGEANVKKMSRPLQFASQVERDLFTSQVCNNKFFPLPELSLYKPSYPFQNFCLIYGAKEIDREMVRERLGMSVKTISLGTRECSVFSDKNMENIGEKHCLLSGMFLSNGELIFGSEDAVRTGAWPQDDIGNYTYISIKGESVEVSSDYFGVTKLYYYYDDDMFFVSNSYHLVLLILKICNINISLNNRRALANFAYVNMQPFHQAFSCDTDISNLKVFPVGKYIKISNEGVGFERTGINEFFDNRPRPTVEEYEKLIHNARDEVVGSVKAALNNPRFKSVILDLSGGMDSRAVYCAVTRLPQYKEKIFINSQYSEAEPKDLEVAVSLARLYNYKYDSLSTHKKYIGERTMWDYAWSYNLGQYFSYVPNCITSKVESTIRLVGFYGEICARPYYSRKYFNSELDVSNLEEFVEGYFGRFAHMSLVSESTECHQLLSKCFYDELSSLPGNSPLEKFEFHYLFYRNGLHCSGVFRNDLSCPEWGPLMSKSLFEAKCSTFTNYKSIKVQLDLMNVTNPVVAAHVYQSESDNVARKWVAENQGLIGLSSYLQNLEIPSIDDKVRWEEAVQQKKGKESTELTDEQFARYRDFDSERDWIFQQALGYLFQEKVFGTALAFDLWVFFKRFNKDNTARAQIWNLVNKTVSLAHQKAIVNS